MARRAERLFEIIQLLRDASKARALSGQSTVLRAEDIARDLEVSVRTIYRDIAVLQARQVPIDGEAGIGYILRPGYELPPLMFSTDELEALIMGARITQSWTDEGLAKAAGDAIAKITDILPDHLREEILNPFIVAPSHHHGQVEHDLDIARLRKWIRGRKKISFSYHLETGISSRRVIWPLALVFYGPVWNIVGWCELRDDFRAFRPDRMSDIIFLEDVFPNQKDRNLTAFIKQQDTD